MTETKETGVTQDMQEAAAADLAAKNLKRKEDSKIRTFKQPGTVIDLYVSDIYELPKELNQDGLAPTSYLAQPEGDITGSIFTQTFSVREERLKGLVFDQPARRLQKGMAIRTIKAIKPNGNLAQLPFTSTVNNQAGGSTEDAIGLRKYTRKGFIVLFDFDSMAPIYCMARNCWAAAMVEPLSELFPKHRNVIGSGYCSYDHMAYTEPQLARQSGGMFETGVTSSFTAHRE